MSCLCRGVLLELDAAPIKCGHCHCANCRRAHGAACWTWASFPRASLRTARGSELLRHHGTDTGAVRSFCGTCGSTLLYASPRWPGEIDVSVANVDGELGIAPSRHTYADRCPSWAPITDDLPRLGGESGVDPL